MFNTYTSSKYDTAIVLICLCVVVFIYVMISSEIEKSKNKFKNGIIAIFVLAGIFGFSTLASRVKSFEYVFYIFIVLSGIFILCRDGISFYNKKKCSKGIIREIKIKNGGTLNLICFLILELQSVFRRKIELIDIFVIIILLIDLPMSHSVNNYLNLYENGILLGTCSFPRKLIPYDEIIPYEKIENLTFLEYDKGKFNLEIQAEKSIRKSPFKYKIKDEEKKEIISFISHFIEKEKITILKEYD